MPEPITVAAASAFQTTLLLLYFVTSPASVPKGTPKETLEKTSVWTLQSASQIPTQNPDMCTKIAVDMINEIAPVATLTVRAYCLCPAGNGSDKCFNEEQLQRELSNTRSQLPIAPTVQRIGPKTELPQYTRPGGPATK